MLGHEQGQYRALGARKMVDLFQGSNRFVFESDEVPVPERVDMARELAGRLFGGFHLLPTNDPEFRAGMWASRTGDVVIGSGYLTAAEFRLGACPGTRAQKPAFGQEDEGIFWIYLRGEATVQQGAVEGVRECGSAWFMHADMPGAGLTEGTHVLALNMPSKALRRAVGHNRHLAPLALHKGNPLIGLLTGYIESAKQLPADTDPAVLSSIGMHLTDLVALALGPTREAAEEAEKGGLKTARLDAVLRAIDANYTDPEFSVADVAAQLKLSVRYVQDILHETGIGFSDRVTELRLTEACELLRRAHITKRKVSDIAFSCGFNNLSYFHRAFRRRFGMTPAGARPS